MDQSEYGSRIVYPRMPGLFTVSPEEDHCARTVARKGPSLAVTPSVLAKAFRGELVPQDATDEAAGEVLERMREQRNASTRSSRKGSSKRRNQTERSHMGDAKRVRQL